MSEQRGSSSPPICDCGHRSYDHDPWPECELCDCREYSWEVSAGVPPRRLRANEGGLVLVELRLDLTEWDRTMRGRPPEEEISERV